MEAALDDDGANATAAEPDEQGVTEREVDLVEGAAADDDPDPEDLAQAAMEAEESDEEADDEWRLVCLKRPDDVTIEYSDFEQFFLESAFTEWDQVLSQLQNEGVWRNWKEESSPQTHLIEYFLSEYLEKLWKHVNTVRRRLNKRNKSWESMVHFVQVEMISASFKTSPTKMYQGKLLGPIVKKYMREVEYFEILEALQKPVDGSPEPYSLDKEIVDLETTVANVCCKLFTKTSIVAIDDDKIPITGKGVSYYGFASHQIKNHLGPVNHMAASLLTSLSLGTRLERRGDTTDQIVRALITRRVRVGRCDSRQPDHERPRL